MESRAHLLQNSDLLLSRVQTAFDLLRRRLEGVLMRGSIGIRQPCSLDRLLPDLGSHVWEHVELHSLSQNFSIYVMVGVGICDTLFIVHGLSFKLCFVQNEPSPIKKLFLVSIV